MNDTKFRQNRSRDSAHGLLVLHFSEVMHFDVF